ncbi:MAG TPA: thioesterase family protein [Vicinamibacteria bacterium]
MSEYGFRFPMEVRFRDLDALGHVNNAVYLTYMESARIAYWLQVTARTDLRGMDMILARAEVDFRAPLQYRNRIEVGVRCASMRRSSLVLEHQIVRMPDGLVVAEARKILVHYDYAAGRSTPLPPELRQRILAQDPGAKEE